MKKLLLTACLLAAVSLNIKAQKGESAASLNALLDVTESGDCVFGSSLAVSHNFTKGVRLQLAVEYYTEASTWNLVGGVNFHYLLPVSSRLKLYPIAGVGFVGGHTKYVLCQYDPAGGHYDLDCEENIGPDFYVQPGAGIEYDFAEKLSLHFEGRWRYSHGKREWVNNGVFGIGVYYRF